jgi:hypothetical protein
MEKQRCCGARFGQNLFAPLPSAFDLGFLVDGFGFFVVWLRLGLL